MNKLILTDVDDVLLDWRFGMLQHVVRHTDFHDRELPALISDLRAEICDRHILEHGYPKQAGVESFNASPFFGALHAHLDAASIIPELARRGYRFVAISAAGGGEETVIRRRANLEAVFGPVFDEVILVPLYGSKLEILRRFEPSIWVEDNPANASDGITAGHRSFLLTDRRVPAVPDPLVRQVTSWREIARDIGEDISLSRGKAAA